MIVVLFKGAWLFVIDNRDQRTVGNKRSPGVVGYINMINELSLRQYPPETLLQNVLMLAGDNLDVYHP